ncbi:MAG: ankyrin repeat domain-containing protein [Acidobacteria bacterium]|nr:ankyrin repeat domain-containing protein [Acidobacteriota bacterium]
MFKRISFLFCFLVLSTAVYCGGAEDLLLKSAEKGDIEGVKNALKKKVNINAKTSYHDTALALSAKAGAVEIVKLLLSKGADVNTSNKWGDTPLHLAAANGNLEIVKLLVQKNADIHQKNYLDFTPMFSAAINGSIDCLRFFIEEKGMDVNAKDKIGMTPLIRTCYQEKQQLEIVKYLVEKGANINEKCQGKYRALHYAAMRGHNDIVDFLLQNKANVNAKSAFGETALDLALKNKRILAAKIIRKFGGTEGDYQF